MRKLTLGLLDADPDYMGLLTSYIRSSDYAKRLVVKQFTGKQALEQYVNNQGRLDLLFADSRCAAELSPHPAYGVRIEACHHLEGETTLGQALNKYQPLNRLLPQLIALGAENVSLSEEGTERTANRSRTRILSVYSAVGGAGKTTVACNLAAALGLQGHKVFYLNLEGVGSELIFQSTGDGGGFAKMLYYLKAQPEHAAAKLLALKSIDPETKVEFLPPLSHIPEMKEVREEETVRLVEAIVDTGDYDAVVLDLDSIPEDRVQAAFSQSDVILWLLQDDRNHLHKAALLYSELQKAARWKPGALSFILNRYTGRLVNDFSSLPWEISGHFPYVPEWKEVRESKQLKEQPIFREQVMQWYLRYGREEATQS